mgnify:CR=1 FL=1
MATLKSVIEYVDEIKPNAFSNEAKTQWLNECEGLVQTEVLLLADAELVSYSYDTDKDKELLVKHPHVKIYWAYLTAMIDFANGEYNKYQNTMQMFNAFFGEYMRWFALWYHPADTHGENDGEDGWRGYYISAYGLAVKHGFEGTESEWLESLYGEEVMLRYDETADELQWKYKSAGQWDSLMDTEALRGEIISQTLSAAQSAKEKAESAQTAAETAASSASASAQNASASEASASAAAQSASASAQSAQAAAEDAQESKAASTESAQTATEKATAAQAAAETAEAAQEAAEAAKKAAVTASTSAKDSADDAQSAKASAEAANTQAQEAAESAQSANTSAQAAKDAAETANTSAQSAKTSAENAETSAAGSAASASTSAQNAQASEKKAESWAVGGTGTRTGEDANNAKYWSEQARNAAGGGVSSFNGRAGVVTPQAGDYTAKMVGADETGAAETVQGNLDTHAENTAIHTSTAEKTKWNGKSEKAVSFTVTLSASAWSGKAQTASNSKFATSGYAYTVCPAGGSFAGYAEAVIYADDVSESGKMTFHCNEAPTKNLTVNILRTEATA